MSEHLRIAQSPLLVHRFPILQSPSSLQSRTQAPKLQVNPAPQLSPAQPRQIPPGGLWLQFEVGQSELLTQSTGPKLVPLASIDASIGVASVPRASLVWASEAIGASVVPSELPAASMALSAESPQAPRHKRSAITKVDFIPTM